MRAGLVWAGAAAVGLVTGGGVAVSAVEPTMGLGVPRGEPARIGTVGRGFAQNSFTRLSPGDTRSVTAECAPPDQAISGGYEMSGPDVTSTRVVASDRVLSGPASSGSAPQGWRVTVWNTSLSPVNVTLTVNVYCAS